MKREFYFCVGPHWDILLCKWENEGKLRGRGYKLNHPYLAEDAEKAYEGLCVFSSSGLTGSQK